jgi:NYN domain-containing protein
MPDTHAARLAVLIDADNASAKIVDGLFEEIAKLGEASVRRIYGDFSSARSKGWAEVLSKYALDPRQQFAYTSGKNASDITLVIEAMDLLHSGRFQGFCLVSSDSDFTRLAGRIREEGVDVFGFGEKKTPESFGRRAGDSSIPKTCSQALMRRLPRPQKTRSSRSSRRSVSSIESSMKSTRTIGLGWGRSEVSWPIWRRISIRAPMASRS